MSQLVIPPQADIKQRLPEFPSRYRGPAFRAIEWILKSYDGLADGKIKTWRSMQGKTDDMQAPTVGMAPLISLSPTPMPNTPFSEISSQINFVVAVEILVPGTCFEDIDGIWTAIEDAVAQLRPFQVSEANPSGTVNSYLCNLFGTGDGVWNLKAMAPAFSNVRLLDPSSANQNETPNSQRGVGSLTCYMKRPC